MTEEEQDENLKKSLDLIRQWGEENKPPTLFEKIRTLGYSVDCTYGIIDAVKEWIPKEHDTNSYDWNRCVRMLREKLE
jgi:hypothetical protein